MNRHRFAVMFFVGVVTSLLFFPVVEVNGQGVMASILHRIDAHNRGLLTLTAGITVVKYDSQLKILDTTKGNARYLSGTPKHKLYIRIDLSKPFSDQLSVIGNDFELYRPRLNQVFRGKINKANTILGIVGVLAFVKMSPDELSSNFTISYLGKVRLKGASTTWHLLLKPKKAVDYSQVEFWVDRRGMPRQAKITDKSHDTTTVLLTKIQKNVTLRGEIFKLRYPWSAKRIKL